MVGRKLRLVPHPENATQTVLVGTALVPWLGEHQVSLVFDEATRLEMIVALGGDIRRP
jgi:hypothetical protein